MIISIDKLRKLISTTEHDLTLEFKLQALETLIREYTNNNFQNTHVRAKTALKTAGITATVEGLKTGDTIQISQSCYNNGLYTIVELEPGLIKLDKELTEEPQALITKVEYPADVVHGTVNLLKWELSNRDKVGIQSESISRHSVNYFNMDGDNSVMGYPKSLMGFLTPYKKARF